MAFSPELFVAGLGLVGGVILLAALLSGLVERSGVPQVGVLLALGAVLGPAGLGLLEVTLASPALRVVATLSLALVLFTDALTIDRVELRRHAGLAALVLGPGTLLSAVLIALAGWWLLDLHPAAAAILGAALASTDPVLLRGLLRRTDLPADARQALKLESGLNDAVLLPIVLCALPFLATGPLPDLAGWGSIAIDLFLLGPGAGMAIGLVAIVLLHWTRERIGVRRDYESLYSLGVAFSAFAAAEAVHSSGFLAAFAAGLMIAWFDVELCDCFREYGETTAELLLLFTFVLFGSSLIWSGLPQLDAPTVGFAVLALLVRPFAFFVSLAPSRLSRQSRLLIAWFGPRGLSSLLLVLLAVFAGTPGSERLFSLACVVVLLSVLVHGGSMMGIDRLLRTRRSSGHQSRGENESAPTAPSAGGSGGATAARAAAGKTVGPATADTSGEPAHGTISQLVGPNTKPQQPLSTAEAAPTAPTLPDPVGDDPRLSTADWQRLVAAGETVLLVDARSPDSFAASSELVAGALRIDPLFPVRSAKRLDPPRDAWLLAFCT